MAARKDPKYYVYQLSDPRSGKPFYVGKGSGGRMYQHVREARESQDHPKCRVISAIQADGLGVVYEVVKRFRSEGAAYRFEARLIKKIGRANLTNLTDGGRNPLNFRTVLRQVDADMERDKVTVAVVSFMAKKTGGFKFQPVLWFGGMYHAIKDCNVQTFRNKAIEVIQKRGLEWVNKIAAKESVAFPESFAQSAPVCA